MLTFYFLSSLILDKEIPKELKPYHNHYIKISGFLYQTPKGDFILASEPDLKSCCIDKTSKINRQIRILDAPFVTPTQKEIAVTLSGRFAILRKEIDGKEVLYYTLKDVLIHARERNLKDLWIPILGLLGLAAAFLVFRKTFHLKAL